MHQSLDNCFLFKAMHIPDSVSVILPRLTCNCGSLEWCSYHLRVDRDVFSGAPCCVCLVLSFCVD